MARSSDPHFLPDLGSVGAALRFVMLAIIIALVIAIGRNNVFDDRAWTDFSLLTLFAVIIAGLGVATLRFCAPLIRRLAPLPASGALLALLLTVIALGTELLLQLLYQLGLIAERWPSWHPSLLTRSLLIGAVVGAMALRYLVLVHRVEQDAKIGQEARLQALQSRIRPHFLFNSLNSVASLTRSDPARAEAVLQDLADLFRVLLADARKLVPITAEREIARQYLAIEQLRLGDRLKVQWNVSNVPKSAHIPALTLQPLLENAIYHGIEPRFSGGTLRIELWSEERMLNLLISNPLPEVRKQEHGRGNRIAQENIRQRLASHFGAAASMQAFEEGNQYHVKLRIPIVRG
jgi:two-component system sensor histidine kinase AlgZ